MSTPGTKRPKVALTVEHFAAKLAFKPFTRMLEVRNKEPGYEYRHVRNDPHRINYFEGLGYEVDMTDELETSTKGQPDSRKITAGTYIVMRRPTALGELHREALRQKAARMRTGPARAFQAEARKVGIETEDSTRFMRAGLEASMDIGEDE